jgi:multimeric flavodoxin WrbA/ribosomal protein S18 acetylase RimI-like enzyme
MFEIAIAEERHIPGIVAAWEEMMDFHAQRNALYQKRSSAHLNFERFLRELMSQPASRVFVAVAEGYVAGFVSATISEYPRVFLREKYGNIFDCAVRKEYRRQGIGRALLERAAEHFRQAGITRKELRITSSNEISQAFWGSLGFQEYVRLLYLELTMDNAGLPLEEGISEQPEISKKIDTTVSEQPEISKKFNFIVVVGSPRRGSTHGICRSFEEKVRVLCPEIGFEYMMLKEKRIEMCLGCQVCLIKGGEKCPIKDDIPEIIERLSGADGFIMASPGYNQHVPGIMKNFIDRLSHICHSPILYGKNALVITTVGGMGLKPTMKYLSLMATCWGAHVVDSMGVMTDYLKHVPAYRKKIDSELDVLARKFCSIVTSGKKPAPNLNDLIVFASLREETRFSPHHKEYWERMGWADRDYYYPAAVNPLSILVARVMGFIIRQEMSGVFGK